MIVRKAIPDDLDSLSALFDAYRIFYQKESDPEGAKTFLEERMSNKESEIFVTENKNGTLTGFVQLYPLFSSTRMKRLWLLNDLFVHPDHRGKGISVLLIDASKNLAGKTGSCGLILETGKSNLIGNNLYPKTGFSIDTEHNFYSWDC